VVLETLLEQTVMRQKPSHQHFYITV